MVRLTSRLSSLAGYIKQGERVIDVGTDHGLLPIYLIQNNITNKVILADINEGPLEKAKGNLERAGIILGSSSYTLDPLPSSKSSLYSKVSQPTLDIRQGDGLDVMEKGEADKAVIAGMGGNLIIDIMARDIEKSKSMEFVLQPRKKQERLSKWLYKNGFTIKDESLVKEGFYIWQIIHVIPVRDTCYKREIDFAINPILIEKCDPLLSDFIQQKLKTLKKIYNEASKGSGWIAARNHTYAEILATEMEKMLERYI